MKQSIHPKRSVFYAGEVIELRLEGDHIPAGSAWIRTNLNNAACRRCEVIDFTEKHKIPMSRDWRDIAMKPIGETGGYQIFIPLSEVGIFEAKCFLVTEGKNEVVWPEGGNFHIKVEAAENIGGKLIYSAFTRQFLPDGVREKMSEISENLAEFDANNFTVLPPSGTFRELAKKCDFIFNTLGSTILQLLPIHPTPKIYGRMGRYGSPFAVLDYFAVDDALAEFDCAVTPMEQFIELVDAVHDRAGRIFLDIPVNHTGWGSVLQNDHPEYFVRRANGEFESPGAWGVVWEDLCKLDYRNTEVHRLMAEVFLFWSAKGVDGFRCDAGYMLPIEAWEYIVAKVRNEFPDTVFLLEGLGGSVDIQNKLLGTSGLDWGYSELFQNYERDQIYDYFRKMDCASCEYGELVNFAETHDNLRLAAVSKTYSRMRVALTALLSENGAFGFVNGVEFYATERIDVHGNGSLNWGAEDNQVSFIARLQKILKNCPQFYAGSRIRLLDGGAKIIAAKRVMEDFFGKATRPLLALINLDCDKSVRAGWKKSDFFGSELYDLITERKVEVEIFGDDCRLILAPGEAVLLGLKSEMPEDFAGDLFIERQRVASAVFRLWKHYRSDAALELDTLPDREKIATQFLADPAEFCRLIDRAKITPAAIFKVGRDERRLIMLAADAVLLVESEQPFSARIRFGNHFLATEKSLKKSSGGHFAFLILSEPEKFSGAELLLELSLHNERNGYSRFGHLKVLPELKTLSVKWQYDATEVAAQRDLMFVHSTTFGGMSQIRADWGKLGSKYDALLAAGGKKSFPVDRTVLLSRCRCWAVNADYSQVIDLAALVEFAVSPPHHACWSFEIPVGQGKNVELELTFAGKPDGDAIALEFKRIPSGGRPEMLEDEIELKIIIRPDVDCRTNHQVTHAYLGAETLFPRSVSTFKSGFVFAPGDNKLQMEISHGAYVAQPEWKYMEELELEKRYGQDFNTDIFSPGYFFALLKGGESTILGAAANDEKFKPVFDLPSTPFNMSEILQNSMRQFIVRRNSSLSVIAGYPWFLDWGRDTLIFLRGMIAAGMTEEAGSILLEFASYEEKGTIPNVIHGSDVSNRDTSDAPLWLISGVCELIRSGGAKDILSADCKGRSLREVLFSIADNYRAGTPNGIKMDEASKLIWSPAHFTWMDTNYPAGTPREGYPVEIQALWYAALEFLGEFDAKYADLATEVAGNIEKLFFNKKAGVFGDCIHAGKGISAFDGVLDDHIRCNALFAVTLGAIKTPALAHKILNQSGELLVPGGIRSLADRRVDYPLAVFSNSGRRLNDPHHPYIGIYQGSEDEARKVSYHNGTVWQWPFPSYCEALAKLGGAKEKKRARQLLASATDYLSATSPGMIAEIADGDYPHRAQGCPAQAWSVSELLRVYLLLK